MATSAILRYIVPIEKMNSRLLLQRCVGKLQNTENCIRCLTVSSVQCSDEKKPGVIKRDLQDLVSSVEIEELRHQPRGLITISDHEDLSIVSGVPEEHIKTRMVRIYKPAKNAMQSGTDNINFWQIDFDTRERWENALMGWTSSGDPMSNMKVDFGTVDEAIEHCKKMNWQYYVQKPNVDKPKPRSYGANFSWNKRTRVTTK